MADPVQNWMQSGQGYSPMPPVMQRMMYPGVQQPRPVTVPSVSTLTREERQEAKRLAEEANFSFDGYQVVRREFISHIYDPAITICGNSVTFNNACISKLEDVAYVQILINPAEHKMVIRPCSEGARDAVRWCIVREQKRKSRKITCQPFTAKLYELMGWTPPYRYKLQGMRINYDGEQMYMFDLDAKETFLPQTRDPNTGKRIPSKPILPNEWIGNFGMGVEEHAASTIIDLTEGFFSSDTAAPTTTSTVAEQPAAAEQAEVTV